MHAPVECLNGWRSTNVERCTGSVLVAVAINAKNQPWCTGYIATLVSTCNHTTSFTSECSGTAYLYSSLIMSNAYIPEGCWSRLGVAIWGCCHSFDGTAWYVFGSDICCVGECIGGIVVALEMSVVDSTVAFVVSPTVHVHGNSTIIMAHKFLRV